MPRKLLWLAVSGSCLLCSFTTVSGQTSSAPAPGGERLNATAAVTTALAVASDIAPLPQHYAAAASKPLPWTKIAVASNPRTPSDVLSKLTKDACEDVRKLATMMLSSSSGAAATGHGRVSAPGCEPGAVAVPTGGIGDPAIVSAVSKAQNPGTMSSELESLAADRSIAVVEAVARRTDLPASLQVRLAEHPSELVRCSLAGNRSISQDAALKLACAHSVLTRQTLAAFTPILEVQRRLSVDKDVNVRAAVGGNGETAGDILAALSRDSSMAVLVSLADNPRTPSEALLLLCTDREPSLQATLIKRKDLPIEGRRRILEDGNFVVKRTVAASSASSPDELVQLAADIDPQVRSAAAVNPRLPQEAMRKLSQDPDPAVVGALAANSGLPTEMLDEISRDERPDLRRRVARNPGAPENLLTSLAKDPEPLVRQAVAENVGCPVGVLRDLATDNEYWLQPPLAAN